MKVKYFWESFCGFVRVPARGGAIDLIDLVDLIDSLDVMGDMGSMGVMAGEGCGVWRQRGGGSMSVV